MHEFAICRSLLGQVEEIASDHDAVSVSGITLAIGQLSGVEPRLLERAFTVARAGTIAADAALEIETVAPRVKCGICDVETDVSPNRLICGKCGDWHVKVTEGGEMLLKSIELEKPDTKAEGESPCARLAAAR